MVITKDCKIREELNILTGIKKSESILNSWLQRDLSIFERILITKIKTLSRIMYPAFSLAIPVNLFKSINQMNHFIWKNKHHYLRKRGCCKMVSRRWFKCDRLS